MPAQPPRRRFRRFLGPDPQRDVDEELAFHLAMREEEFRREGMTAGAAHEAAMRRFGNVARVRDECGQLGRERARRARRLHLRDALRQDLRFALRSIVVHRAFSLAVALTLAIGIGANSAVFSVAYGLLLRPLPYRDADALARLWSMNAERGVEFFSVSPADYAEWRAQSRAFAAMAAYERQRDATLGLRDGARSVQASAVEPDVFPLLGAPAWRGRALQPADGRVGAPPVAVLSHALWSTQFGADGAVVGRRILLDGTPHTVVGVMPPRFLVPGTPAEVWTPLALDTATTDHGDRYLRVLARLAPGQTLERARLELDGVAARLAQAFPGSNASWRVNAMAVPEMLVGREFRRGVLTLVGVVGIVLLVACANAANLQLARGAARRREIALRAALGASRGRIALQLLAESLTLGGIGGALGLLLAHAGVRVLRAIGAETVPRLEDVRLDAPVLLFTAGVALGGSLLFGLLPSLRVSRPDVGDVLKGTGRGGGRAAVSAGLQAALVVAQVSLSLVLLVGAGLLARSFARLQAVDVGFDARAVAVTPLRLPQATYGEPERRAAFFAALLDRARAYPGVASAALVSSAPFAGPNTGLAFQRADRSGASGAPAPDADYRVVTPGYLRTLGIRLLRGRDFTALDRDGAPETVLVSETMARRHWPGEDPVGARVRVGDVVDGPVFTVVGVVADARYQTLETPEVRPMMYFSALARPQQEMALVTRGPSPAALAAALRGVVASLDAGLPAPEPLSLERLVRSATATQRFVLVLFAVFGGAALLLVAVGIHGVMSYLVRQRTHELGVRLALGARPSRLVLGVVGRALGLAVVGVGVGLAGAWALSRTLAALLFGVSATDPTTFAVIALLLVAVAALASLLPARRATHVDPLEALRAEG